MRYIHTSDLQYSIYDKPDFVLMAILRWPCITKPDGRIIMRPLEYSKRFLNLKFEPTEFVRD